MRFHIFLAFLSVLVCGLVAVAPSMAQFNAFEDPGASVKGGESNGPEFKVSQEKTGEAITLGQTAEIVTLFKNTGGLPVEVGTITLYPSSTVKASVSNNMCAEKPLPPQAECAISVSVTAIQVGSWRVEMLIEHTGLSQLAAAKLSGNVIAGEDGQETISEIETDPVELDFGSLTSPTSIVRAVKIKNRTPRSIEITNIFLNTHNKNDFEYTQKCIKVMDPSESCVISLTWLPRKAGPIDGVLVLEHTGDTKVTHVNFKGSYAPAAVQNATQYPDPVPGKGLLVSSIPEFTAASVDRPLALTATLLNSGDTPLEISSISLTGATASLSFARSGGCRNGTRLDPQEACPLILNVYPAKEGAIADNVQIRHTGARGLLILPVNISVSKAAQPDLAFVNKALSSLQQSATSALDGYSITSHSKSKAIISGPSGSQVVRDGALVVLAGIKWVVHVTPAGVDLVSRDDEISLIFDSSLSSENSNVSGGNTGTSENSETQ